MNLEIWPCFEGWSPSPSMVLATRRAVYGKVHRAPTDYRWIAWSDGFGGSPTPLEQDLALGSEDRPSWFHCWLYSKQRGGVAARCYPSRASDAAGRPAGIEKQIVAASPDASLPPAAMAFLLLASSADFDDTVWWETWREPRWASLDFHLTIPAEQCPAPLVLNLDHLVELGLHELLDHIPGDSLEEFYAVLGAGAGPAVLRSPERLLSPLALAALLLPLDRATTEDFALAGGFPAQTLNPRRLPRWTGIVCPSDVVLTDAPPVPAEARGKAASMVRSLQRAIATSAPAGATNEDLSLGGRYLLEFLESSERWFAPGEAGGESLSKVGPWPVVRRPAECELLRSRVATFIDNLEALPPNSPARRHLATKADLLRALLLVLCPDSASLQAVSLPKTGFVPALYFASRLDMDDWSELTRYSPGEFETLVNQSLAKCRLPTMVREVKRWLAHCAEGGPLAHYAGQALQQVGD